MNTPFVPRSVPPERGDDDRRGASSPAAPVDYLELCRREFIKRYFRQVNGDDYEFSHNAYGDRT